MYQICSRILNRENELLNGIAAAQTQVREAVVKREWADFENLQALLGRIGAELEGLEGERKTLFCGCPPAGPGSSPEPSPGPQNPENSKPPETALANEEAGFFRLIAGLPPGEQRELAGKYRELRMAGIRVRINNDNLLAYIAGIRSTMSAFIESVFPDRKGRVYSRSGAVVPQDMRSMVLNRSL
jgi:hypothetical protein